MLLESRIGCLTWRSNGGDKPCARVGTISSKKNENWYTGLVDFDVPNNIQLVMIWRVVTRMVLCTRTLALRAVNVNWNDNGWNDNWWFAGLCNSLHFSFVPYSF